MIAETLGAAFAEPPPERSPKQPTRKAWRPRLGPIGMDILRNETDGTVFIYGERGSLKTGILVHKLIYHCYQAYDPSKLAPLALMVSIIRSAATEGGMWEKLNELYLPEWYDGIGLEATPPKMDDQKSRYLWIGTQYGQWSRVVLRSIPHGESIKARIKGIEPSFILFDELPETDHADYYLQPDQQLRRPTGGPRQFVCSGNPPDEGTEHWTWKLLCQRETGETGEDGKPIVADAIIPAGGGRLEGTPEGIAVYHVPISENVYWSAQEKKDYQNKLLKEARLDPTAEDRLIKGIWTPRPKGEGLFKGFFNIQTHVKPVDGLIKKTGLLPIAGYPIILGYDIGQVWNSVTFEQRLPLPDRTLWTIFDELDYFAKRIVYRQMANELLRKMLHWRKIPLPTNNWKPYPFEFVHITDESALNQWRPGGDGNYDAWEFERVFNAAAAVHGFKKTKLIGCPKPAGSVGVRVNMVQSKLQQDELFVSAQCPNTKGMLLNLEASKEDPDKPRRNKWLHKFDSLSYPILKMEMLGSRAPGSSVGDTSGVRLIKCGSSA